MTDVTPDTVGLSWTVPRGKFDSFVVQYKDRDGQPRAVPVAADQREVIVTGLQPNRKYKFLLYGLVGRKQLGPVSAEGTTGEPSPACAFPSRLPASPPSGLGVAVVTPATDTPWTPVACQARLGHFMCVILSFAGW